MPARPTNEPGNYFAFGFQSAKDTEASTFQFLRHLDGTGFNVQEQIESVREGGDGQEVGLRYKTAVTADGSGVANERPEVGHRLMVACLGADAISTATALGAATTASGVANEHLATPTAIPRYLTVEQFFADEVERSTNNFVTGVDIEFEAGRPLKVTAQFIAGGSSYPRDVASVLTPTRESGPPFFYPGASVVLDGTATGYKVTKGKVSIKRNVDDAIRTTGLNREDVVALNFDVDVDLTVKYEDKTLYNKAHYNGGTQVPVDLATTALRLTSILGQGTSARQMEIGVNQLHITDAQVNKLDPDGKTMYLDFAGMGYKGATHQVYQKTTIASVAAI